LQLAEYEALGVPPRTLRRSAQLRLAVLSAFGILAGALGAFLSGRLVGAFVAVTGTARRPLPPIESVVSWPSVVGVVIAFAVAGGSAAALLTRRQLRGTTAGRLRA
jgi:ABC-type antimicrobial peptide transport system permease subunit